MTTPLHALPPALGHALLALHMLLWVVFATYGLHRLHLVRLFRRLRPAPPPVPPAEWPRVTIQLPVYNERYVIDRLMGAMGSVNG